MSLHLFSTPHHQMHGSPLPPSPPARPSAIMLQEPPKAALLAYESGQGPYPERVARVWVTNPPKGDLYEALVTLSEGGPTSSSSSSSGKDTMRQWQLVSGSGLLHCDGDSGGEGADFRTGLFWQQQQQDTVVLVVMGGDSHKVPGCSCVLL